MIRLIQFFFGIAVLLPVTNVVVASGVAGTLGELEGKVLVNQGQNYVPGRPGMQLKSGARVLAVGKNSYAVVVHSAHCTTRVSSNALFVSGSVSPCKGGPSNVQKLQPGPIGWKKVALTSGTPNAGSAAAAAAPSSLLWGGCLPMGTVDNKHSLVPNSASPAETMSDAAAAAAPGGLGAFLSCLPPPTVAALAVGGMATTGAIAYGISEAVSSDGGRLPAFNPIQPLSGQ